MIPAQIKNASAIESITNSSNVIHIRFKADQTDFKPILAKITDLFISFIFGLGCGYAWCMSAFRLWP